MPQGDEEDPCGGGDAPGVGPPPAPPPAGDAAPNSADEADDSEASSGSSSDPGGHGGGVRLGFKRVKLDIPEEIEGQAIGHEIWEGREGDDAHPPYHKLKTLLLVCVFVVVELTGR